jgi:hypothetical protein
MVIGVLFVVGLLEANATPSPSPVAGSASAAAASKDGRKNTVPTKGERKYINGSLGSIDAETGTVRFVDQSGRTLTWPVDRKLAANSPQLAAQMASAFKPGDPIMVAYQEDTGAPTVIGLYRLKDQKKTEQEGAPQ